MPYQPTQKTAIIGLIIGCLIFGAGGLLVHFVTDWLVCGGVLAVIGGENYLFGV